MTSDRTCPQCGQPYAGRADKLFCSNACRAQHFRDQQAPVDGDEDEEPAEELDEVSALGVLTASTSSPAPSPLPLDQVPAAPRWNRQALQALIAETVGHSLQEQAAQREQAARHARYQRWVQAWLERDGQPLPTREVPQYLREAEELSVSYRAHPAITQAGHPAQLRLEVLYKVGDALRELAQPPAGASLSRTKSLSTLEFSKKRRQQLRASLLGEA